MNTAIRAFSLFPDQWKTLQAEPKLLRNAFDEALRWDSPSRMAGRIAVKDVEIDGVTIPAGTRCGLMFAAANRDPRKWEDPDSFRVERVASGHVGFGFGIHQCLGQMVARLEGELVLNALLKRVSGIRLAGPPVRRLNNTLHAIASLPVEIVPA